ncbi:MAG TPA: TonB-dependent siderophore receptor [Casimicrobiaceae bacterium]|nr:TonB-dependent siderophore receptor [Casimicrobiaceae bacterium]
MTRLSVLLLALAVALPVRAQAPVAPAVASPEPSAGEKYAQYLVDSILARHPELREVDLHATPPGSTQSMIVAAKTESRVGKASDPDDIAVMKSGEPRIEINPRGNQDVEVELPLFDIYNQTIGAVELTFPYVTGTDPQAMVAVAAQYRDQFSRRILEQASLFEPVQLDPRIPVHRYSQFLVDDTLAKYPEIEVMALHARTPSTGGEYLIIASNIGRIGKPADETDLEVIRTGKPHSAADRAGRRFESKVLLQDASGTTLGVVAIIFPLRPLSNAVALEARAEQIAAELRPRIASAAALDGLYPTVQPAELAQRTIQQYNQQELGNKQELPMTKEVASGQQIAQTTQDGYSDAVKNQAGLQPTNSTGSTNDAFAIRGIKLNLFSNYRIDGGVPIAGVITMPTEDKQRVETLKGANALMFGVASPAGIINFVTKRAGPRDITTFGVAGNSFGQYGGLLDVGRRYGLEQELGVRVNYSATHLENGVHDLSGHGQFASAGVDWRASSRLTVQGDYEYYDRYVPEQAGISLLPAVQPSGAPCTNPAAQNCVVPLTPVPNPRNNLIDGWNQYSAWTNTYQGRADYLLSDDWRVLVQAGQSVSRRQRGTVRISGYDINTGANGTVTVQPIQNDYQNTFYRSELLGHVPTWFLINDLTVGTSYTSRKSSAYEIQNVTLPQKQNIFDPIVLAPPVYTKPGTANPPQNSKDWDYYFYDTITILPQLKGLAGVRWVKDEEVNGPRISTSWVASPGYGVLYDILPTTTLFASYLQGLEAGATAPANAANANVILAPTISRQKEIGLRDSYFKGLSVSLSYFDITRANAVTDPVTNIFDYNGNTDYKGVEAVLAYTFLRDWTLNAAVLWLDAIQNAPNQPLINGKVPENTPKWNGNVSLSYRIPQVPGLTVKGGLRSISQRPINPQDQGNIPGYTIWDASANYGTLIGGRRVTLQLSVDNLSNKRYWNSVQTGTYGIGMATGVKFSARMDY